MTGHDQDKLSRTCGQIFFKESISQCLEVRPGNSVASVWIFHEPELLVEVYQLVEQALRALKMNVVIACAVNDKQFALQAACEINWGTVLVTLRIFIGQTHIALLVNRIIQRLVRDRCARNAHFEKFRRTKHQV